MAVSLTEKTKTHLEWGKLCERLAYHCRGPLAMASALDLAPLPSERELRTRLARTDEARALLDAGLTIPFGRADDVKHALVVAQRHGVLDAETLHAIGGVVETSARCRRYLADMTERAPELSRLAEELADLPDLGRSLRDSFTERGELADSASGELYDLRQRVNTLHGQLKDLVSGLLSDEQYDGMLQDDYYTIRDERYVLPIRSGHKNHVSGIVHGWSGSGATVFIEPQSVVDSNNRLLYAQADVDREVHRILSRLSKEVGRHAQEIAHSLEALAALDLAWASGLLSRELSAVSPALSKDGVINLKAARHPLLALGEAPVVPNDLTVDAERCVLVLTGPNTGGKTVALKTIGLCTAMALSGLHIPADSPSTVALVPAIYSDIGDEQSLEDNLSTFSGHLANLQLILDGLEPGSLVLLDELVVGTDPLQGAALAQAILEHFAEKRAAVVVTTHYENLKVLPYEDPRFRNGAMGFDPDTGRPSYQLALDIPGASSALRTARRLGLAESIVDRAADLAGPDQRALQRVIEDLEKERDGLRKAREEAEAESTRLLIARESAERREETLKARLKRGLDQEQTATLTAARALRDEVKALRKEVRRKVSSKSPEWLNKTQARAAAVIEEITDTQRSDLEEVAGPQLEPSSVRVGQTVWVLALNRNAEVVSLADANGKFEVRAGIMTMRVAPDGLRRAAPGATPPAAPRPKRPPQRARPSADVHWDDAPPQTPDNTVDLRGLRVDESLERAERFLDECYGRDATVAFLIHGHGTGALKREIRSWLKTCRYVRAQRPGLSHEGGDGVTAVLLT